MNFAYVVNRPSTGLRVWQLFTLLLFGLPTFLQSQGRDITVDHLSDAQGLLGKEVHCIIQDKRGFMWFGTESGLNKYDGYSITSFKHDPSNPSSIVNAMVQSLCEDSQGMLWVGTWQGLEKFDRASNTFSHYRPNSQAPFGDTSNLIYDIREDRNGNLWLGGQGLIAFDRSTESFQFYRHDNSDARSLAHNNVNSIFEDKAGVLWIGTGGGLEQLDRSTRKFSHYWRDEQMHSGFFPDWEASAHWIQTIFESRSRILWLGTNGGPVAFDRTGGKFRHYAINLSYPDSLTARSVSSICEDNAGVLWIGTWGAGLMTYDASGDRFVTYHLDSPLLTYNSICSLYKDRGGVLWAGTNGDGVLKIMNSVKLFTPFVHNASKGSSLSNNDVRYIYQERSGTISIGTALGEDKFDRRTGVFSDPAAWERPYAITAKLRSRSGICWTGIEGDGINKILENPYRRTFYSTQEAGLGGSACSMFEDRRGLLWMLISNAGLCQFNPNTEKFKNLGIGQTQPFVSARLIVEDSLDNTLSGWVLWIGTNDGLWKYDARVDAFMRFGHDPKDPASLASNTVTSVFRDSHGALWIGTDRGLNRMDSTEGRFESFTDKDGLPDNSILGVLDDGGGHLWVSTPSAISRFEPNTKRFTRHGMKDILPGIRFSAGCCLRSEVGEMYFGGHGGFIMFHPDSIAENEYVPPVAITGFKKFDATAPLDTTVSEKKMIELSYTDNVFSFEFSALNFRHPEENQYAYKLEGHDNDWTYCGNQQYARYMNVEPGKYTFRVKGSNNDGVWNEEGTSIAVIISPPFWRTGWFTALFWLAVAGSIGGAARYVERRRLTKRIEQLEHERALERERARISEDMHDEVGASLSEIAILSELAKKKPEESIGHVEEISERAAEVIDNVSEIVWALNPKNDTLDNLVAHVRQYAVRYMGLAHVACTFTMPDEIPVLPLASEVRRNLFLVVKEALHNVTKHAKASAVSMRVTVLNGTLQIVIEDNGRGFTVDGDSPTGNGLGNMKKRMADIGGMCTVTSEPNRGTRVSMEIVMPPPQTR